MNIHFYKTAGGAFQKAPTARGHKPENTAATARTRPGATYPGGKYLRRALTRLAARKSANTDGKTPGSMRVS